MLFAFNLFFDRVTDFIRYCSRLSMRCKATCKADYSLFLIDRLEIEEMFVPCELRDQPFEGPVG